MVAYLWWMFLGPFGAHYFYLGKRGMGWLYLGTAGLFGLGWLLIDPFTLPRQIRTANRRQTANPDPDAAEEPTATPPVMLPEYSV